MARKTKYIRVQLDFIMHFDDDLAALPYGLDLTLVNKACQAAGEAINDAIDPKSNGFTDARMKTSVFHPRKRTKKRG